MGTVQQSIVCCMHCGNTSSDCIEKLNMLVSFHGYQVTFYGKYDISMLCYKQIFSDSGNPLCGLWTKLINRDCTAAYISQILLFIAVASVDEHLCI